LFIVNKGWVLSGIGVFVLNTILVLLLHFKKMTFSRQKKLEYQSILTEGNVSGKINKSVQNKRNKPKKISFKFFIFCLTVVMIEIAIGTYFLNYTVFYTSANNKHIRAYDSNTKHNGDQTEYKSPISSKEANQKYKQIDKANLLNINKENFSISKSKKSNISMKCIGALIDSVTYPFDLRDEYYNHMYMFPCLDNQIDPKYVMVLFLDKNTSNRTVQVYELNELFSLPQKKPLTLFNYPNSKPIRSEKIKQIQLPLSFHSGLVFLSKETNHWKIYQRISNKTDLMYTGIEFPWYFGYTYKGFSYSFNNTIYLRDGNIMLSFIHINNDIQAILSYDIPHKNFQAINYYLLQF